MGLLQYGSHRLYQDTCRRPIVDPSSRYLPFLISSASFSASISTRKVFKSAELLDVLRRFGVRLQTFACVCPGGRNGKTEISTSRSPLTPNTFPFESTTASASPALPIAPVRLFSENPSSARFWQLEAMLTCGTCMMYWPKALLDVVQYLCICFYGWSWCKFRLSGNTACCSYLTRALETLNSYFLICLGQQPIGAYQRIERRVGRIDCNIPTRCCC